MANRNRTTCRCYIIPPHMLQHMAAQANAQIRDAARTTLLANRELVTQREIFAALGNTAIAAGPLRRTIYDARNEATLPGDRVRSEGDAAASDATVNEAYDGAGVTHAFYDQIFHRHSVDDRGMRLDATVHYREEPEVGYDNAFWNGRQMVYGDGDQEIFGSFTRSLDVIAHELTHGVTQFEAALVYHKQSGALNESFSDVFGSMVKQWHLGQTVDQADWLIGQELLLPGVQSGSSAAAALRSLKAPGTGYDDKRLGRDPQPAHMSNFQHLADTRRGDNGGVHINSGIPNHAFYLACTHLGAAHAWDQAGPIWYATLRALHAKASFLDAAKQTVMQAEQFGADAVKAVRAAWQEVGVLPAPEIVHVLPILPRAAGPAEPAAAPPSGA
ncbi:MAG: M4 family metallopeptidase [Kofleriaceae bacterium]